MIISHFLNALAVVPINFPAGFLFEINDKSAEDAVIRIADCSISVIFIVIIIAQFGNEMIDNCQFLQPPATHKIREILRRFIGQPRELAHGFHLSFLRSCVRSADKVVCVHIQHICNPCEYLNIRHASQDTDRREIIYTAGWEKLLTNDAPDLLLVLMIVLLATQPFAREYETEMTKILLPSANGRAKLCTCKLIVVLIAAVGGTLLFLFIDILTAARLGLDNFNSPLESIPLFCDTPERISLLSALIMIELIRLLGYTIFSAGTLLLSSIFKKTLPAMCVSFGLILIQYTGFGASDFKYRYAIPYGLMLAVGYIKGESSNDNSTKTKKRLNANERHA